MLVSWLINDTKEQVFFYLTSNQTNTSYSLSLGAEVHLCLCRHLMWGSFIYRADSCHWLSFCCWVRSMTPAGPSAVDSCNPPDSALTCKSILTLWSSALCRRHRGYCHFSNVPEKRESAMWVTTGSLSGVKAQLCGWTDKDQAAWAPSHSSVIVLQRLFWRNLLLYRAQPPEVSLSCSRHDTWNADSLLEINWNLSISQLMKFQEIVGFLIKY